MRSRFDRRTLLISTAVGGVLFAAAGVRLCAKGSNNPVEPLARDETFPKLPIGMNLAGIADWEPGFPFKNLFWGARPWLTRNLSGKGPHDTQVQNWFQFDENGYPLEVPITAPGQDEPQIVFTYVPNVWRKGRYVLLYEGDGEIQGYASTKVISRKPGRIVFEMAHAGAAGYEAIGITVSKRGNHIRNIRLVAETDEKSDLALNPFLPKFLDFCRPFHCLRFMDWGAINNSIEEKWSDRKKPTFYTMVPKAGDPDAIWSPAPTQFERRFAGGVAYEHMIQLCNLLKIDMWICVPHRANDDYITQLARLVKLSLDPALKVYLEYSNEIWNWQFRQAGWMLQSQLAGALVEAKGGSPWEDVAKTKGRDHPERIGALFRRVFSIWEREFAGEQHRLIRVAAVQAAWADASKRTIRWCLENGGVDAVSPAAYVGPDSASYQSWETRGDQLTPEMIIEDMYRILKAERERGGLLEIVNFAKDNGLKYVAYEGGQHIQPKDQKDAPYSRALAAVQNHHEMYGLYIELLRLHRDLGCEMFGHFSSVGRQGTRWGSWGAKLNYDAPNEESPKMRALLECNSQRKAQV